MSWSKMFGILKRYPLKAINKQKTFVFAFCIKSTYNLISNKFTIISRYESVTIKINVQQVRLFLIKKLIYELFQKQSSDFNLIIKFIK